MTMDGDEVRKKGTVAGGYRDPNRSKMQLAKGYKVGSLSSWPLGEGSCRFRKFDDYPCDRICCTSRVNDIPPVCD